MPVPFAHKLYWIKKFKILRVSEYIQHGYSVIDCAAAWGEPNTHLIGEEFTTEEVYRHLLPTALEDWLPEGDGTFPIPFYQDGWRRPVPDTFITAIEDCKLSPPSLAQWLSDILGQHHQSVRDEIEEAMYEPHLLLRCGYRLAQLFATQFGVKSHLFQAAMAAAGMGSLGLHSYTCDSCFRRTRASLRFCDMHSQSKLVQSIATVDQNRQVQQARTGRTVAKRFVNAGREHDVYSGFFDDDLYEFELRVGSILWPLAGWAHQDWLKQVATELSNAPIVSSRLPSTFELDLPHVQLNLLQFAVGSREWVVSRWPKLIRVAEAWLTLEKVVAPGPKAADLSQLNRSRMIVIKRLLDAGYRRGKIAVELNISKSHLSQLIRRDRMSGSS